MSVKSNRLGKAVYDKAVCDGTTSFSIEALLKLGGYKTFTARTRTALTKFMNSVGYNVLQEGNEIKVIKQPSLMSVCKHCGKDDLVPIGNTGECYVCSVMCHYPGEELVYDVEEDGYAELTGSGIMGFQDARLECYMTRSQYVTQLLKMIPEFNIKYKGNIDNVPKGLCALAIVTPNNRKKYPESQKVQPLTCAICGKDDLPLLKSGNCCICETMCVIDPRWSIYDNESDIYKRSIAGILSPVSLQTRSFISFTTRTAYLNYLVQMIPSFTNKFMGDFKMIPDSFSKDAVLNNYLITDDQTVLQNQINLLEERLKCLENHSRSSQSLNPSNQHRPSLMEGTRFNTQDSYPSKSGRFHMNSFNMLNKLNLPWSTKRKIMIEIISILDTYYNTSNQNDEVINKMLQGVHENQVTLMVKLKHHPVITERVIQDELEELLAALWDNINNSIRY